MTKKIPCKVISSLSLSADSLSMPSYDFNRSIDTHIVSFHSIPGMFTYDVKLRKSFISYDKASYTHILDYYA
jgi:hypothetical protein